MEPNTFYDKYSEFIDDWVNLNISEQDCINLIRKNGYDHFDQEISIMLEDTFNYLKTLDDRCDNCARIIDEEDYITKSESRGICHGITCFENMCYGYICRNCGHREDW